MADEADHRIANHQALLAGSVRLKASAVARGEPLAPEAFALILGSLGAQLALVARLHRALIGKSRSGAAPLAPALADVCRGLAATLPPEVKLTEAYAASPSIAQDVAPPVAQILTEPVTNAIKHSRRACARASSCPSRRRDGRQTASASLTLFEDLATVPLPA